jgi:hypothetical protein
MSAADFLIAEWMYILCVIAVVLIFAWISLKPYDESGKIIWSLTKAHKARKARKAVA